MSFPFSCSPACRFGPTFLDCKSRPGWQAASRRMVFRCGCERSRGAGGFNIDLPLEPAFRPWQVPFQKTRPDCNRGRSERGEPAKSRSSERAARLVASRCRANWGPICTNFWMGRCGTTCVFIEKRETSGQGEGPHNCRAAGKQACLDTAISPHWLRHALASHALDHDAPSPWYGPPSVTARWATTSA